MHGASIPNSLLRRIIGGVGETLADGKIVFCDELGDFGTAGRWWKLDSASATKMAAARLVGLTEVAVPSGSGTNVAPNPGVDGDPFTTPSTVMGNSIYGDTYKVFDRNLETYAQWPGYDLPWHMAQLDSARTLVAFSVRRSSNVAGNVWWETSPYATAVQLVGSDTPSDYGSWVELYAASGLTWAIGEKKDFTIVSAAPFKCYQVRLSGMVDGIRTSEIELISAPAITDYVIKHGMFSVPFPAATLIPGAPIFAAAAGGISQTASGTVPRPIGYAKSASEWIMTPFR